MEQIIGEHTVDRSSRGMELINRVIAHLQTDVVTPLTSGKLKAYKGDPLAFDQTGQLVFSSEEVKRTYEACQELRMQLSVPLIDPEILTNDESADALDFGSVVKTKGGVIYTTVGNTVLIQIPDIRSADSEKRVISGVFQIYDNNSERVDWMIDLSGVTRVPMRLLYSLIGHKMSLESKGSTINLAWLSPDALPELSLKRAAGIFEMIRSAGFYFSKKIFEKRDARASSTQR